MSSSVWQAKRPCKYFNTFRGCKKGNACTFSHQTSPTGLRPNQNTNKLQTRSIPAHANAAFAPFPQWERLIPETNEAPPLGLRLSWFFKSAETLVKQSEETRQSVVTRLATEGGLTRINEVTRKLDSEAADSPASAGRIFRDELVPLLRLLSYPEVTASLLLETPREKIMTFLSGPGDRRAKSIFKSVAQQLQLKAEAEADDTAQDLEASAVVLAKILDLSSTAALTSDFDAVLAAMTNLFGSLRARDPDLSTNRCAKSIDRIARRLGKGAPSFLDAAHQVKLKDHDKPTFQLQQDAPGHISDQGQRHDNDFLDIHNISILPTASELQARRSDFLPVTTYSPHCEDSLRGLLDRQFRLLREDTVGLLREGVKAEYETRKNPGQRPITDQGAARTFAYNDAILMQVTLADKHGVLLGYEFSQPEPVRARETVSDRRDWWHHSKRLQQDALICVIDAKGSPLFCVVVENGLSNPGQEQRKVKQTTPTIFESPEKAYITLSLVEISHLALGNLLDGYIAHHSPGSEVLVEFPGVLLPSFKPTLQALQNMSLNFEDVPFRQLIAPPLALGHQTADVEPPDYFLKKGFSFDLSSLLQDEQHLRLSAREPFDLSALRKYTTLDPAQAESLKYALTHKLALIQGPPGTGKSFTGVAILKALVHNAKAGSLGPLICVTYTNHALDQILEQCHASGIKQIVRVGSQSKSEILEKLNLRHVVLNMVRTRTEKQRRWAAKATIDEACEALNQLFHRFILAQTPAIIQAYLMSYFPHHCEQLFRNDVTDEDGFQFVGPYKKNPLQAWLRGGGIAAESKQRPLKTLCDLPLSSLNRAERHVLFMFWVQQLRLDLKAQIITMVKRYQVAREDLQSVFQEQELRCLRQAEVIGMTTSGLARIIGQLKHLHAKVIFMEEAGEVLEAHTLVTMLPSVEHAILIGDHQQLRPQAQNYDLSVENPGGRQYAFDVSLFERLVAPLTPDALLLPKRTLEIQRRMHPSIANLVRSTLYPKLEDGGPVAMYPVISGMRKRLFWYDHQQPESHRGPDIMATSRSNEFEVDMTVALVSHLMSQGCYGLKDVAILTPYLGQLRKIRKALSGVFTVVLNDLDTAGLEENLAVSGDAEADGVEPQATTDTQRLELLGSLRIATVDNFQGEEAKCVVVSLVRSNEERKCGFLRTTNRINVLLSRAQHGMYLIGNSDTYSTVPMWNDVIEILKREDNFGDTFALCCPRHPDRELHVKSPDEFATVAPQGGCDLRCVDRLGCGHACPSMCHSEALHQSVRCLELCTRKVGGCEVHPCPRVCGDPCPARCETILSDVQLPCGHKQDLPCWEAEDIDKAQCHQLVEHTPVDCGHTINIPCHLRKDPTQIRCFAPCGADLPCGHQCRRLCRSCRYKDARTGELAIKHGPCQQICGRPYTTCQHSCQGVCHGDEPCGLCKASCDTCCSHSKCSKKCCEPCTPCAEEHCASRCPHSRCSVPCGAPCDWLPCEKRCPEILKCGHQCPSLCGEACPPPKYCQVCADDNVKNQIVDFILSEIYADIDLNNDPCIFPRCGHILTRSSMDGSLDMQAHYEMDETGKVEAIKSDSEPFSTDMRRCPTCRGSLRDIRRYGRIVRRALLDVSTKRLITFAQDQYRTLQEQAIDIEDGLSSPEQRPINGIVNLQGPRRNQFKQLAKLSVWARENSKVSSQSIPADLVKGEITSNRQ